MNTLVTQPTLNGYKINAEANKPCYQEPLEQAIKLFENYLQRHNKMFFVRFDLSYPSRDFPEDNSAIVSLMENLNKHFRRERINSAYGWAREEGNKGHHYHCFILLDGAKVQNCYRVLRQLDHYWSLALGGVEVVGCVNYCTKDKAGMPQKNGIMVRRGNEYALNQVVHWTSYLFKTRSKLVKPGSHRRYGFSQLKGRR